MLPLSGRKKMRHTSEELRLKRLRINKLLNAKPIPERWLVQMMEALRQDENPAELMALSRNQVQYAANKQFDHMRLEIQLDLEGGKEFVWAVPSLPELFKLFVRESAGFRTCVAGLHARMPCSEESPWC